jgi:hypothetical protein
MCKNFLHLLSFFVIFLSFSAEAQTFKVHDLERLIKNHPMMKNYDPKTNRFRNTPSEARPLEEIDAGIISTKEEISALEKEKKSVLGSSMKKTLDAEAEKELWKKLNDMGNRIKELKQNLLDLTELQATNGVPPASRLLPIAREILLDIKEEITTNENEIVLNYLPRFYQPPPNLIKNPLKNFFANPDQTESLLNYIKHANLMSLLFSGVAAPVLYNERNLNN